MTKNTSARQRFSIGRGKLLENLTVRQKLNILIAFMTLGVISLFAISMRGASSLNFHSSNIYNDIFIPVTTITQAETIVVEMQLQLDALHNIDLTSAELALYLEPIDGNKDIVSEIIETYRRNWLASKNPGFLDLLRDEGKLSLQADEFSALNKLTVANNQFLTDYEQLKAKSQGGSFDNEFANKSIDSLSKVRYQLRRLEEINSEFASISNNAITTSYQDNNLNLIITLFIVITFGLLLSYSIANSISSRLKKVEDTAISFQDGYLDRRTVMTIQGSDEIANLANTFNHLFNQVQDTLFDLEKRVDERTAKLAITTAESERRARLFEAITLVGNAISSLRSLDDILPKITELISQQFGYYHVGIFLNDTNNDYAVLRIANSEGGKRMLERGHQLKIGEQGIVGYVTSTGKPRIALDVGDDATYFDNPDLPDTRSEMALPLRIGDSVVGALDVQSTEEEAFSEDDINVLTLLADQVSMAIENARLFDQARRSISESETLYRQYLRQAWGRLPKEQNLVGFRYNAHGSYPIEMKSKTSTDILSENISSSTGASRVSIPISIRGETIGALTVRVPENKKLKDNQLDMVNAVAERVALSVENARLFEETNRRAERERLVSDITVKIRSTNDPEAMIKIALDELKNALGATNAQLLPHSLTNVGRVTEPMPLIDSKSPKKENEQGEE